jgi:hypothetical protein
MAKAKQPRTDKRAEPTKPSAKPTRDRIDRSSEAALEHSPISRHVPGAEAIPTRRTVDSRRRS